MRFLKKIPLALLLLLVLLSPSFAADGTVVFITANDMHSTLESSRVEIGGVELEVRGFANMVELMNGMRVRHPGAIAVETGDVSYGPLLYHAQGKPEYELLNLAGVRVGALGNHEFDYGTGNLAAIAGTAKFPILASNMTFLDPILQEKFPRMYILESGPHRVGFFALMTPALPSVSSPGPGVAVDDDLAGVARRMVAELRRGGADVIVALTHIGLAEDMKLAREVEGIHVIFGGHSHDAVPLKTSVGTRSGWRTLIAQAMAYTQYVGLMELVVKDGAVDVANSRWHLEVVTPQAGLDPEAVRVVREASGLLDGKLGEPLGEFLTEADTRKGTVRGGESAVGSFIAEAFRWRLKCDIGVVNGGNVRGDKIFPAGPVSYRTLTEISPYANRLTKVALSGAQLRELAELGASAAIGEGDVYDEARRVPTGGFLQYAGMRVKLDLSRSPAQANDAGQLLAAGSRVVGIEVEENGSWVAPDPKKLYSVATSAWTAGGGDRTVVMKEAKGAEPTEIIDNDAIADYLRDELGGRVSFTVDGRIEVER